MKSKREIKFISSHIKIATLVAFLLAVFQIPVSYADNISPEMSHLTAVKSMANDEGAEKAAKQDPSEIQTENVDQEKEEAQKSYEEERMHLLKPTNELYAPMESEYSSRMFLMADRIERKSEEETEEGEKNKKEDKVEKLLRRVDEMAVESVDEQEFGMGEMNWIEAESAGGIEEMLDMGFEDETDLMEAEEMVEFEPTRVSLIMAGGQFMVDYSACWEETWMTEALQDQDAEQEMKEEKEEEEAEKAEDVAAVEREMPEAIPTGIEEALPDIELFSVPAPMNIGAQIVGQIIETMFFKQESAPVELQPELPLENPTQTLESDLMMEKVLKMMTLAPPLESIFPAEEEAVVQEMLQEPRISADDFVPMDEQPAISETDPADENESEEPIALTNGITWNGINWNGVNWNGIDWNEVEPVASQVSEPKQEAVSEEIPATPVAVVEETPEISEAVSEEIPAASVAVVEETPEISEAVSEEIPATPVAAVEETPEISEAVSEEIPAAPVAVVEETPEISEAVSEEIPAAPVAVVEETPEISEAVSEEIPAAPAAVVEETPEISETEPVSDELLVTDTESLGSESVHEMLANPDKIAAELQLLATLPAEEASEPVKEEVIAPPAEVHQVPEAPVVEEPSVAAETMGLLAPMPAEEPVKEAVIAESPAEVRQVPEAPVVEEPSVVAETMGLIVPMPVEDSVKDEMIAKSSAVAENMGLVAPIPSPEPLKDEAPLEVMKTELPIRNPDRIAEAMELLTPAPLLEPRKPENLVGDIINPEREMLREKVEKPAAEDMKMSFPELAFKVAVDQPIENIVTRSPNADGIFKNIVKQVLEPMVATVAPVAPKFVSASISPAIPRSTYSFSSAPARANFLENHQFKFASYTLPSVSYYRLGRARASRYSASYGSRQKQRRRYFFQKSPP